MIESNQPLFAPSDELMLTPPALLMLASVVGRVVSSPSSVFVPADMRETCALAHKRMGTTASDVAKFEAACINSEMGTEYASPGAKAGTARPSILCFRDNTIFLSLLLLLLSRGGAKVVDPAGATLPLECTRSVPRPIDIVTGVRASRCAR